jgi:large subunit ribosomal protein L2
MGINFFKPRTPELVNDLFLILMKLQNQNQKKHYHFFIHRAKGRNNRGVITCRHRGGGQNDFTEILTSVAIKSAWQLK